MPSREMTNSATDRAPAIHPPLCLDADPRFSIDLCSGPHRWRADGTPGKNPLSNNFVVRRHVPPRGPDVPKHGICCLPV